MKKKHKIPELIKDIPNKIAQLGKVTIRGRHKRKAKMDVNSQPSILVRLVHSVPHINVTLSRVNSTFDPKSIIYKEVSIRNLIDGFRIACNVTLININKINQYLRRLGNNSVQIFQ